MTKKEKLGRNPFQKKTAGGNVSALKAKATPKSKANAKTKSTGKPKSKVARSGASGGVKETAKHPKKSSSAVTSQGSRKAKGHGPAAEPSKILHSAAERAAPRRPGLRKKVLRQLPHTLRERIVELGVCRKVESLWTLAQTLVRTAILR